MTMEFDHYAVVPPNIAEEINKASGVVPKDIEE